MADRLLTVPGSLELSDQCRLLELDDAAKDLTHQDRSRGVLEEVLRRAGGDQGDALGL